MDGEWEETPHRIDSGDYAAELYYHEVVTAVTADGEMHVVWNYAGGSRAIGQNHTTLLEAWNKKDPTLVGSWGRVSSPHIAFGADGYGFATWLADEGPDGIVPWVARFNATTGKWQNWQGLEATGVELFMGTSQV